MKDKRTTNFADDPDRRPVYPLDTKSGVKAASPSSSPTSLSSIRVASRRSATPSIPGTSKAQADRFSKDGLGASPSHRASSSKRKSSLKKTPSRPSKSDVKPMDSLEQKDESGGSPVLSSASDGSPTEGGETAPPSSLVPSSEGAVGSMKPIDATAGDVDKPELSESVAKPSGGAVNAQGAVGEPGSQIPAEGPPGGVVPRDTPPGLSNQEVASYNFYLYNFKC